jgi:hypothetical protein
MGKLPIASVCAGLRAYDFFFRGDAAARAADVRRAWVF